MMFLWVLCIIPLLVFMMVRGSRNRRGKHEEEEEIGPHMSDPMYDKEEGFEEEGDDENIESQEGKLH